MQKSRIAAAIITIALTASLLYYLNRSDSSRDIEQRLSQHVATIHGGTESESICHAVLLKPGTALTSRHCLSSLDPQSYQVKFKNQFYEIDKLIPLDINSLHYPNLDLVKIILIDRSLDEFADYRSLEIRSPADYDTFFRLDSPNSGNCQGADCRKKVDILRPLELVNGARLRNLQIFSSDTTSLPCKGESGGPLFGLDRNGNLGLVGLLSGKLYPFTSRGADCNDPENLFTMLNPYKAWIRSESQYITNPPIDVKTNRESSSLEHLCREKSMDSKMWFFTQELLLQVSYRLSKNEAKDVLIRCDGADKWGTNHLISYPVTFREEIPRVAFDYLERTHHLTLTNVDQFTLDRVSRFAEMKSLTILGCKGFLDFKSFAERSRVTSLVLKHCREKPDLKDLLSMIRLDRLSLVDLSGIWEPTFFENGSGTKIELKLMSIAGSKKDLSVMKHIKLGFGLRFIGNDLR